MFSFDLFLRFLHSHLFLFFLHPQFDKTCSTFIHTAKKLSHSYFYLKQSGVDISIVEHLFSRL